eukprot:101618-Prorocentrum_minimum.AAC.1
MEILISPSDESYPAPSSRPLVSPAHSEGADGTEAGTRLSGPGTPLGAIPPLKASDGTPSARIRPRML